MSFYVYNLHFKRKLQAMSLDKKNKKMYDHCELI